MRNSPFWSGSLQLDTEGNTQLDRELSPAIRNVIIGQYFEYMATRVFGGELMNKDEEGHFPDIVKWGAYKKRDVLLEVKASYRAPIISVQQLHDYKALEKNDFPYTRPRIYYVVFLHSATLIESQCKTVRDLIGYLSRSVDACLVLPIDAVLRLVTCNNGIVYEYGVWRGGTKYIRWSKRMDRILRLGDRSSLVDFLDLVTMRGCGKINCFKDFQIKRQLVQGLVIQRFQVNDFPVLSMRKKKDWRPELCKIKSL